MKNFKDRQCGTNVGILFNRVCPRRELPDHSERLAEKARRAFRERRMGEYYRLQQEARVAAQEEGRPLFSLGV